MIDKPFWQNKRYLSRAIPDSGVHGSACGFTPWGRRYSGYALDPPTDPSLFRLCKIDSLVHSTIADVRDGEAQRKALIASKADIAFHLAAKLLVWDSYKIPVGTYAVNVMGTMNFFEAIRHAQSVRSVVNVTTDKGYENREWVWGYRENEPL